MLCTLPPPKSNDLLGPMWAWTSQMPLLPCASVHALHSASPPQDDDLLGPMGLDLLPLPAAVAERAQLQHHNFMSAAQVGALRVDPTPFMTHKHG